MAQKVEVDYAIEAWKKATGNVEIDMHEVVKYAVEELGWPLPEPVSPYEVLARHFSRKAREATRQDPKTGDHYRRFHAYPDGKGGQGVLWIDIDEAPRNIMLKSTIMRREQVVGDMLQLELDLRHWNNVNPKEEPIVLVKDLTEDVAERLAGPNEEAA
ncbi:MAG: hypothetical protein SFY81_10200 [Verrucomicrobiota bacterium]|nr:hypothetical protein [Verrucomicrobiota bacterium]